MEVVLLRDEADDPVSGVGSVVLVAACAPGGSVAGGTTWLPEFDESAGVVPSTGEGGAVDPVDCEGRDVAVVEAVVAVVAAVVVVLVLVVVVAGGGSTRPSGPSMKIIDTQIFPSSLVATPTPM